MSIEFAPSPSTNVILFAIIPKRPVLHILIYKTMDMLAQPTRVMSKLVLLSGAAIATETVTASPVLQQDHDQGTFLVNRWRVYWDIDLYVAYL